MRKFFLIVGLVLSAMLLTQPQSRAGVFISLPIPIPFPVFYRPAYSYYPPAYYSRAYYPPGYYYGPYGYAYDHFGTFTPLG